MADAPSIMRAVFTTVLVVNLALMGGIAYLLSRRPILLHLKEIYFINSAAFKRAWYLVIAGMTLFIAASGMRVYWEINELPPLDEVSIFDTTFVALVMAAFLELLFVFSRYLPHLGADDEAVLGAVRRDLRSSVLRLDEMEEIDVDVSIAEDVYGGRPEMGPYVGLSHYRAVVLGMTQYMEHRFGELGDAMFYAVGRQTGRQAAEGIQDDQTARPLLEEFLLAMQTAAVGRTGIVQDTGDRISIRIDECAVCAGIRPTGDVECHYLTGLFTGLMETAWKCRVDAQEIKCHARGDAFCEFQVDKE